MVNVTHDGNHRRTTLEVLGCVVKAEGILLLGGHDAHGAAQVVGNELNEVVAHGLSHGERSAKQEQTLDDVVGGDVESLGELGHGHALGHLDGVKVHGVGALRERLLGLALLGSRSGLGLTLLLALLTTASGLAGSLLDGGAGLLEDLLAAVLLGLASHAGVAILALDLLVTLALLAALAGLLRRRREIAGHGRSGIATTAAGRGVSSIGISGAGSGVRVAVVAATATALRTSLGGSLLGLRSLLLLEHDFLLGDLVEQRAEALTGVGCGDGTALGLELGLTGGLLGLLLGTTLGLLLGGAGSLSGSLSLLRQAALLLTASLGCQTLGLLLLRSDDLGSGDCLLLGLLSSLDLGGTGLNHRGELLLHHGHIGVLKRR